MNELQRLSVDEVAERDGITRRQVFRRIRAGIYPAVHSKWDDDGNPTKQTKTYILLGQMVKADKQWNLEAIRYSEGAADYVHECAKQLLNEMRLYPERWEGL